jgi:hypothetical protein
VSEVRIEEEVRAALDETYRPAPELLSVSIAAVRSGEPQRRPLAWVAGVVAVLLAVGTVAVFTATRTGTRPVNSPNPTSSLLPQPIPQPITRTSAAAQVAWLNISAPNQSSLVAVDPAGRLVARIDQTTAPGMAGIYGVWRSADGSTVFTVRPDQITAYSALDGKVQRTYSRAPGGVVGDAFSPDGHWLAMLLLNTALQLQVIDLRTGSSQIVRVDRDLNARVPGMICQGSCADSVVWGMPIFASDSTHVYTLTDWGGPARLTAFSLEGGKLSQIATAVDGQGARKLPSCSAPAMAGRVVGGGKTLVTFCNGGGAISFFDLDKLVSSGTIASNQSNPFGLLPIFTPDGQLLYLHQSGSGDSMQVVDLARQKLLGPVATPRSLDQSGPFAWLITNAYAGGIATTVPISPDGLKLYVAQDHGVMVLRVPDLKPIASLAPAFPANEVWISGDGRTIYTIYRNQLLVMGEDGSHQISVTLPNQAAGFIASEHG